MRPLQSARLWFRFSAPVVALTTAALLTAALSYAPAKPQKKRAPQKSAAAQSAAPVAGLTLLPAENMLDGSYSFQTLSAVASAADGSWLDMTTQATFTSSNPAVVKVGKDGIAYPVGDGTAEVTATVGGRSAKATFAV